MSGAKEFCEIIEQQWWSDKCLDCKHPLLGHEETAGWVDPAGKLVPEGAEIPLGSTLEGISLCPICRNTLLTEALGARVAVLEANVAPGPTP